MEELLRVKEAAEYLKISIQTLKRWDNIGKFKALRHPMNNYRQYRKEDLEALAKELSHKS